MSGGASDIAIIGMACRFPGAPSPDRFWQNLEAGVESISFFPPSESRAPASFTGRPDYVGARGILDGIDLLDASFFGYTPAEASLIDPQQRLFLECAWETLESAGYDPAVYPGAIGVYAGASTNTYLLSQFPPDELPAVLSDFQTIIANDKDFLATRVSYKLNLRGPSINVQTACSTSLVAVHLACQALLLGECDMALAGGVSIRTPQKTGYLYQSGGIYSPDGHCRPFDSRGVGTAPGNGVGIVLLKRSSDATRDGDYVHAVVKGSAINNDGSGKIGFTAPSVAGQSAVITEAWAIAGSVPAAAQYVEAHGTGTALGDPVEVAALADAFGAAGGWKPCAIGSVKSNIGHLDAAAGIAGLIKAVLSLERCRIPPTLGFQSPNPNINFSGTPFYVNPELVKWPANGGPRLAGVSSFGIGGTNAHVVLEEAVVEESSAREYAECTGPHVLPLSAPTAGQLTEAMALLASHLHKNPELRLADVAYTLQAGRRSFNHRVMVAANTLSEAAEMLDGRGPQPLHLSVCDGSRHRIGFLFVTEPYRPEHAEELCRAEPAFREAFESCGPSPLEWAFPYALTRLWVETAVRPDMLVAGPESDALATYAGRAIPPVDFRIPIVARLDASPDVILVPITGGRDELWLSRGRLWLAGAPIDWQRCHRGCRRRVPLPTFPLDRRSYWVGPPESPGEQPVASEHRRPSLETAFEAARSPVERQLVEIWEELLGIHGVGIHDDFFDLGGHSLMAVQLVARIRNRFAIDLEPQNVFETAGIAELAMVVEHAIMTQVDSLSEEQVQALLREVPEP